MRTLFVFFLLGTIGLQAQNLDDYLWKNRVVLLFGQNGQSGKADQQMRLLLSESAGLKERDLIVLVAQGDIKEQLYENLLLRNDFEGLVLIGKDGGVKHKQAFMVQPKSLFSIIDAMPMRKAEIRSKHK